MGMGISNLLGVDINHTSLPSSTLDTSRTLDTALSHPRTSPPRRPPGSRKCLPGTVSVRNRVDSDGRTRGYTPPDLLPRLRPGCSLRPHHPLPRRRQIECDDGAAGERMRRRTRGSTLRWRLGLGLARSCSRLRRRGRIARSAGW